jgi:hypothetical protein
MRAIAKVRGEFTDPIASQKIIFAHRLADDKDQAAEIITQFYLADEILVGLAPA